MTDLNFKRSEPKASEDPARTAPPGETPPNPVDTEAVPYDLIELLFFAYRDFTGDPDSVLDTYKFGRAHHRVLHFVERNPGIMVTDLLGILRITKQSLGRVLKQLVDDGFILQKEGPTDRRQRLLYTTGKGHALAEELAQLQHVRLERAINDLPDESRAIVRQFLFKMIDPEFRGDVRRLVRSAHDLAD